MPKWERSTSLIQRLNMEFHKVHEAKEGKLYTPQQESRLTSLRKRCQTLTYYRYHLVQKVKK